MKYTIDFENMPYYAALTPSGVATVGDYQTMLIKLTESPEWVVGTNRLLDFRFLDLSRTTKADISRVASAVLFLFDKLGDGKSAFVVEGAFGLLVTNHYTDLENQVNNEVRVFTDIVEAKKWLLE